MPCYAMAWHRYATNEHTEGKPNTRRRNNFMSTGNVVSTPKCSQRSFLHDGDHKRAQVRGKVVEPILLPLTARRQNGRPRRGGRNPRRASLGHREPTKGQPAHVEVRAQFGHGRFLYMFIVLMFGPRPCLILFPHACMPCPPR